MITILLKCVSVSCIGIVQSLSLHTGGEGEVYIDSGTSAVSPSLAFLSLVYSK